MGKTRRYIKNAILETMSHEDEVWFFSRSLVAGVSERVGRQVSTQTVARHLVALREERRVESKIYNESQRLYKWRMVKWQG